MTRRVRHLLLLTLACASVLLASACTEEQKSLWLSLPHDQQVAVANYINQQSSGDCFSALGHFSGDHGKARQVIMRESGNNPSAANPGSSARGCFQTMMSIHGPKYYQVGCTPNDWDNAVCNTKVADILYRSSGWSPWAASGG